MKTNLFVKLFSAFMIMLVALPIFPATPAHAATMVDTFTTVGLNTWTAPADVTSVTVEVWGGGGKGGDRSSTGGGGGGGGGAYASSTIAVTPGNTYNLYVGAGSTTTAAGGDSYFIDAATVMAKGGASVNNNTTNGAAGGSVTLSIGTTKYRGGNGANAGANYGGGGGSSAGTGANGTDTTNATGATAPTGGGNGGNGRSTTSGDGTGGATPGGGGGGSYRNTGTRTGGSGADGQVIITYNSNIYSYSTTSTWTAPAGVTSVKVEIWGGGGRGGTVTGGFGEAVGGGGGGGAYSSSILTVVPGRNYTVTVGGGSTSTAAGGDSSFVDSVTTTTLVLAKGGNSSNNANGAAGGTGTTGTTQYDGGDGAGGSTVANYGGGGGSSGGTGSNGTNATNATGATAPTGGGNGGNGKSTPSGVGTDGSVPGGGGGGAYRANGNATYNGGAGANGMVVITAITNSQPTVSTPIADVNVLEDAANTVFSLYPNFADAENSDAQLTYTVTGNTNPGLFTSVSIADPTNFTLDYAPNVSGVANITVRATDTGGLYVEDTFQVTVTAVNDAPSFTKGTDQTVLEDAGAQTVANWATAISAGPADESAQTLTFNVTGNTNAALFSVAPAVSSTGTLTYTPAANANGSATITLTLSDNGGTANGGANTSASQSFVINVTAVNDAPSFTKGADQTVLEDAGAQTVANWATAISAGPANESAQTLTFNITGNTNAALFSVAPAVSPTGTLTYTPAANANGSATITLTLSDNGGTTNGGVNTSASQSFIINVTAVDDPSTAVNDTPSVVEDSGANTINVRSNDIDADGAVELIQSVTQPANGTVAITNGGADLTYQPNANYCNGGSPTDNFTYTLTGGSSANVNVTVTCADDPSAANNDTSTVFEDAAATTIDVRSNDTDIDSTVAQIQSVTQPANGTVAITNGGADLTYQPNANYCNGGSPTDNFTYTLLGGSTATVAVTVNCINDAPSFTASNPPSVALNAVAQTINNWAVFDPGPANEAGQNVVQYSVSNSTCGTLLSAGPAIDTAGTLTYTPASNQTGSCTFDAQVQDDGGTANGGVDTSATQNFTITVDKAAQTINVTTSAPASASDGSTFDVEATATSGLLVTITTSGACTGGDTDGNATITMTSGTGTCSVFYDQGGDANYLAAPQVQEDVTATSAPAFTSADNTSFDLGFAGTFGITASGNPSTMTISLTGTLPSGINFIDNGDGTASLNGTPTQGGVFNLILTANNSVSPNAVQNFTLTVRTGPTPDIINSNPDTGNGSVSENEIIVNTLNITQLTVKFNHDVNDPTGDTDPEDVTNPANYILVRSATGTFNTISCLAGVVAPDVPIAVDSVTYDNAGGSGPFVATLNINGGLPLNVDGFYRLYVCGTTSIVDAANTALHLAGDGVNPGTDFIRNFRILTTAAGGGGGGGGGGARASATTTTIVTSGALIPVTGFTPNTTTQLPAQENAYAASKLVLEIPSLSLKMPIVGIQFKDKAWDVTWLGNNAGYLEGSAYPTWNGNSVLTGHFTDANGKPGPFAYISELKSGNKVYIHNNGFIYVYEVRQTELLHPNNIQTLFQHEDDAWVTLVTCENFNAKTGEFTSRRVVSSVLISILPEK